MGPYLPLPLHPTWLHVISTAELLIYRAARRLRDKSISSPLMIALRRRWMT